jgi:hypothetical protein
VVFDGGGFYLCFVEFFNKCGDLGIGDGVDVLLFELWKDVLLVAIEVGTKD